MFALCSCIDHAYAYALCFMLMFAEALWGLKGFSSKKILLKKIACFCRKKRSKFIIVISTEKGNIKVLVEKEMKRKLDYALPAVLANW